MGKVLAIPLSFRQRQLVAYREEERALEIVLQALLDCRKEHLFGELFAFYRVRKRHVRNVSQALAQVIEPLPALEDLRRIQRLHHEANARRRQARRLRRRRGHRG